VQRAEPGAAVVVVRGDLDRASVPILAGCLAMLLGVVGSGGTVVVNLAGVDFIDVGGMLLVLEATRRTAGLGSTLYLAGCNALLIRLLVLTGNLDAVNVVAAQRAGADGASGTSGGDC
jgi:anti-anti-sigma factor